MLPIFKIKSSCLWHIHKNAVSSSRFYAFYWDLKLVHVVGNMMLPYTMIDSSICLGNVSCIFYLLLKSMRKCYRLGMQDIPACKSQGSDVVKMSLVDQTNVHGDATSPPHLANGRRQSCILSNFNKYKEVTIFTSIWKKRIL